jgi:hypothetical protein
VVESEKASLITVAVNTSKAGEKTPSVWIPKKLIRDAGETYEVQEWFIEKLEENIADKNPAWGIIEVRLAGGANAKATPPGSDDEEQDDYPEGL